jgi:hypothetical protein
MKKISVLLTIAIFCFLVFDILKIQTIGYRLGSPLISSGAVKEIKHPYIVLAVIHGIVLAALIGFYINLLFKIATIIAVITIIATVIINYFCLLCG